MKTLTEKDKNSHQTQIETFNCSNCKMDSGEPPINIYLELSKAFDTVDHDILKYKINIMA